MHYRPLHGSSRLNGDCVSIPQSILPPGMFSTMRLYLYAESPYPEISFKLERDGQTVLCFDYQGIHLPCTLRGKQSSLTVFSRVVELHDAYSWHLRPGGRYPLAKDPLQHRPFLHALSRSQSWNPRRRRNSNDVTSCRLSSVSRHTQGRDSQISRLDTAGSPSAHRLGDGRAVALGQDNRRISCKEKSAGSQTCTRLYIHKFQQDCIGTFACDNSRP